MDMNNYMERSTVLVEALPSGEQGIEVVRGCKGKVEFVLNQYLGGKLSDSQEACSHHDCHGADNLSFTYIAPKQ